jgi:hypothetical protein
MRLLTNYTIRTIFLILAIQLSAIAAQSQSAAIYFQETYSYNDTFVAAIYLDSFSQVGSVTLSCQFDNSQFDIIEINENSNIGGSFAQNIVQDTIRLGWFSLNALQAPDTFAIVKLLKKQEFCNSPLNWTGTLQVTDEVGQVLSANFYNGTAYFLKEEKPSLVYPFSGDPAVPVNSVFRWNDYNIECESGYHLQVALDSNFTQMITDTIVTDSVFPVTGLQALTTNYWRVAKVDELQNEYWSDFDSFYTVATSAIQNELPTIISWSDTVLVPVTFTNSENVGRFNIDLDYDTTTFDYLGFENLLDHPTNVQVTDNVNGRIEVNWQTADYPTVIPSDTMIVLKFIQTTGCIGDITFNPSSAYYFVGNVVIPSNYTNGQVTFADSIKTNLAFPANNSTEVFIRPELTWDSIQCSNAYQVQVASDSTFTNLFANVLVTDTTFIPTNLSGDSTYYWRVGRYNILDSLYWTDFWKFSTESVLEINLEALDVVTTADTFFLPVVIDSLTNAISFQVHLDYDTMAVKFLGFTDTTLLISNLNVSADSGTVKIYWESLDSSLASIANILSDTLLQLEFEYLSGCETDLVWNTDTSDFYHINSNINIDATFKNSTVTFLKTAYPTQILPVDGANTIMYPDFTWQNMDCVENFDFQISLDDQFTQIVSDSISNDTTLWMTNLQPNTPYFWRVAKEDFIGNFYWSDTLSLNTGDFYTSKLELDSVLTYQTVAEVALTIDSTFFINGFQIELNYDNNQINYAGATNPLFSNITITDNNGILTLDWQDTTNWHDIIQDTLLVLQFSNAGTCKTTVTFSSINFDYRGDALLLNPIETVDGSIEYLNTSAPVLLTPFANETDVFPLVDFVWSSVDCSVEYQLQVSETADFSTTILDTTVLNGSFDDLILDHNSAYYWRVGRWDTQADRYWSDTSIFQTSILPTVQVEAENIVTYEDTMRVGVTLGSVVWAESFSLVLEYDTTGFEYKGFSDTLFGMDVNEQNGTVIIQWSADSSNPQSWLTVELDTIVYLNFETIGGCYTDLKWNNTVTNFIYKTPIIPILNNNTDGSIEWVNDEAPLLVFPPNDTAFMPTSFELTWDSVNCAVDYTLQIASDTGFTNVIIENANLLDEKSTILGLEFFTNYYWRVGQRDSEDVIHWSDTRTFQTDRTNDKNYLLFPNPTDGVVNIWFENELERGADVRVFNSIGQLMRNYGITRLGKQYVLNLSNLDRGIYMLEFDDGTDKWVERIIVY